MQQGREETREPRQKQIFCVDSIRCVCYCSNTISHQVPISLLHSVLHTHRCKHTVCFSPFILPRHMHTLRQTSTRKGQIYAVWCKVARMWATAVPYPKMIQKGGGMHYALSVSMHRESELANHMYTIHCAHQTWH